MTAVVRRRRRAETGSAGSARPASPNVTDGPLVPTLSAVSSVGVSALLASPGRLAVTIGSGRIAFGVLLTGAPERSLRLLGVDGGSARRMAFLARMAGVRDAGLGGGTLVTRGRPGGRSWLVAGALADVVDGIALVSAARRGTVRPIAAAAVAAVAAGASALSVTAAIRSPRG